MTRLTTQADLRGETFGALTVIAYAGGSRWAPLWRCKCACGEYATRGAAGLLAAVGGPKTPSCGCILRGRASPLSRDLTGARFGCFTVTGSDGSTDFGRNGVIWRARCATCGAERKARGGLLANGQATTCAQATIPGEVICEPGMRFGRLTVEALDTKRTNRRYMRCACDCGGSAVIIATNLTSGRTKSCGCLRRVGVAHEHRRRSLDTAAASLDSVRATVAERLALLPKAKRS